jgi:membrane-associated phospholipid phosphatase
VVKSALLTLIVLLTTLLAPPRVARAEQQQDASIVMLGNGWFDVGFVALNVLGLYVGTKVLHPAHRDRPPLDGLGYRQRIETLGRAADVAVVMGLTTGTTLAFLGELGSEARGAEKFRSPVIIMEGALAGSMLTQIVKNAFGVCRPRDWDAASRRCTTIGEGSDDEAAIDEAHRSFPSGHSAPLAGMAGASLGLYVFPTTARREHLAVALTSIGFALTVVVLRERAGAHSWVDTGAAFITGGLAGLATAALHMKVVNKDEPPMATSPAPLMFSFGQSF